MTDGEIGSAKRGVEILNYRTDEKVSKHADMWEWMRAEDLNAAGCVIFLAQPLVVPSSS